MHLNSLEKITNDYILDLKIPKIWVPFHVKGNLNQQNTYTVSVLIFNLV